MTDPTDPHTYAATPGGRGGDPSARALKAATSFTPGALVGGRYRLVALVSVDRHGNHYWRARDAVLPRDMSVTMLPDTDGTAAATVARTLRSGRLHHIGLPPTLDVGNEQGLSFVVGQWVDGVTVTDLVAKGPLEATIASSIAAKIAEAVAEAHRNGIALGAIHPSLIRINADGQVRFSHVIALSSATTHDDICSVGALLYLMLTGTWPLPNEQDAAPAELVASLSGGKGQTTFPAAERSGEHVILASDARPADVPEALGALAERALHPDRADGIHAVGAIATLLREPVAVPVAAPVAATPTATNQNALSAGELRIRRDRRIRLTLAFVVLASLSALIVLAAAAVSNRVLASLAEGGQSDLGPAETTENTVTEKPTTAPPASQAAPGENPAPGPAAPAAAVVPVNKEKTVVYDPKGKDPRDNARTVDSAIDGDPATVWETWNYKQQFGPSGLKPGVGLLLYFDQPVTVTSVDITSAVSAPNPNTVVEIRSAPGENPPLDQTHTLGAGEIGAGPATIEVKGAEPSHFLVVWVTQLPSDPNGGFKAAIAEIVVHGH